MELHELTEAIFVEVLDIRGKLTNQFQIQEVNHIIKSIDVFNLTCDFVCASGAHYRVQRSTHLRGEVAWR